MFQLYVNDVFITEGHSDYISLAIFTVINEKARAGEDMDIKLVWVDK